MYIQSECLCDGGALGLTGSWSELSKLVCENDSGHWRIEASLLRAAELGERECNGQPTRDVRMTHGRPARKPRKEKGSGGWVQEKLDPPPRRAGCATAGGGGGDGALAVWVPCPRRGWATSPHREDTTQGRDGSGVAEPFHLQLSSCLHAETTSYLR